MSTGNAKMFRLKASMVRCWFVGSLQNCCGRWVIEYG